MDKRKLVEAIGRNIHSREMNFTYSSGDIKDNVTVLTSSISLRPNLTYEDLAEDLVSQLKKLVWDIYPEHFSTPHIRFETYTRYEDIEVFDGKVVTWFIPCQLLREPAKSNFNRHIADGDLFNA